MSYRACDRCTALKRDGGRCTRRTCKYGPRCWQHTRSATGMEVKRSVALPAAGLGLFAHRDLPSGTEIPYRGKTMRRDLYETRFPGDWRMPYTVDGHDGIVRDAAKTNSGVARYANDVRVFNAAGNVRQRRQRNAGLYSKDTDGNGTYDRVVLELTRPVRRGREILVDYGDPYWGRELPPRETRNRHRQWIFS